MPRSRGGLLLQNETNKTPCAAGLAPERGHRVDLVFSPLVPALAATLLTYAELLAASENEYADFATRWAARVPFAAAPSTPKARRPVLSRPKTASARTTPPLARSSRGWITTIAPPRVPLLFAKTAGAYMSCPTAVKP